MRDKFYEYFIVNKHTSEVISSASSRAEARHEKQIIKEIYDVPAKIVQRKFVIEAEKVVR